MDERKMEQAFRSALTGFLPGALLVMAILIGLPLALAPNRLERMQHISWIVFALELFLLTGGYAFMTLAVGPEHFTRARWRNVLAGVGALVLMLVASAFFQGAGLVTIIAASISAGMLSASLAWNRTKIEPTQDSSVENYLG